MAEHLPVTVEVDADDLREWAGRHADAGHHGVAHVLYQAAEGVESITEQHDREVQAEALREWGQRLNALCPTDVFVPLPEVRSHLATAVLSAVGISRDAVSADMMRHAARVTLAEADRIERGES